MSNDDLVKSAIAPVVEMARKLTGDEKLWSTHFLYGEGKLEWSLYFVLQKDQQLQNASNSGVTNQITEAAVNALKSLNIHFKDFSQERVTYTTQEYCDVAYQGNWYYYFK